ncbi:hypothetical protein H8E50_12480 [bacterium]|nr:hypothetical protein [bacterium]
MPGKKEFQSLHSVPLFKWIMSQSPVITWWIWCLAGLFALLAINTLFCSIESLIKKRKVSHWLLLIAPQIVHLGFLFILLAHLLSSLGSMQMQAYAAEGTVISIEEHSIDLKIESIKFRYDFYANLVGWSVKLKYISAGKVIFEDTIEPNNPSVFMGFNVNISPVKTHEQKVILLQVNREPGALWALVGGIMFSIGIAVLLILKIRGERQL